MGDGDGWGGGGGGELLNRQNHLRHDRSCLLTVFNLTFTSTPS